MQNECREDIKRSYKCQCKYCRMIEKFRLGRNLLQSVVQLLLKVGLTFVLLRGSFCSWVFISRRMEAGPCPRAVLLTEKLFSLCPNWNFPCCSLCPLPLALLLRTSWKSLAVFYITLLLVAENCNQIPLQPPLLWDEQTSSPSFSSCAPGPRGGLSWACSGLIINIKNG